MIKQADNASSAPGGGPASAAPRALTLTVVVLNSIGTGVMITGIYYIAKSKFAFGPGGNYGLGLVFGIVYPFSALLAGPMARRLERGRAAVSPRAASAWLMAGMAVACALPALWRTEAALWVTMPAYGVLNGLLWPITESYVSGGRSGRALRRATGQFNVAWSGSTILAMLLMTPVVVAHPLEVLLGQGVIHAMAMVVMLFLPRQPGAHHPAEVRVPIGDIPLYRGLLALFRIQLPVVCMVSSALNPYLPRAMERLEIGLSRETLLVAVWMSARAVTFWLMERWHGWHGRWSTSLVAGASLVAGFSLSVAAPELAGPEVGRAIFVGGLLLFGIGYGAIYAAALYYAMAVGSEGAGEAGGSHEALIGTGYAAGPMLGLMAWLLVGAGPEGRFALVAIVLVGAVATGGTGVAAWRAIEAYRRDRRM